MNLQRPPHGIEWTRLHGRPGYTANPIQGCEHGCEWQMPDGEWAECYAKTIAEKLLTQSYPNGFAEVRFNPKELEAIRKLKEPAGIFIDSMSDLFGRGVKEEWIAAVLETIEQCPQHVFLSLTKNIGRVWEVFSQRPIPTNLWLGASAPPTKMYGKLLSDEQRRAFVWKQLEVFSELFVLQRWQMPPCTFWMSIEPLSFDVVAVFDEWFERRSWTPLLSWFVIGAASRRHETFQPNPKHVRHLLDFADARGIKVFFKGNLMWPQWRAEFPEVPA